MPCSRPRFSLPLDHALQAVGLVQVLVLLYDLKTEQDEDWWTNAHSNIHLENTHDNMAFPQNCLPIGLDSKVQCYSIWGEVGSFLQVSP